MFDPRGICLKRYELESLIKSFVLFFLLMALLYGIGLYENYTQRMEQLDRSILSEMKIFSYKPTTGMFQVSFPPRKEGLESGVLHRDTRGLYAYFEIPGSKKYLMQVRLPRKEYFLRSERVKKKLLLYMPLYLALIVLLALLFSFYALYPLKKALALNEEFVKDILHDINTPLSALQINLKILRKRFGSQRCVERMEQSIETIGSMQENLRAFLNRRPSSTETFSVNKLLQDRIAYFRGLYPGIGYELSLSKELVLRSDREAFRRILDNLLDNAGKYNVEHGTVRVVSEGTSLIIEDSGIGIRSPERVFERYYKEGERGLGLGLDIVRKLAKELGIGIRLESEKDKGTRVTLDLSGVILR